MAATTKFWLKEPRLGWRNDGGDIPRRFKGRCRRKGNSTVVIDSPLQKVRVGHWIVQAGSQLFAFSPDQMKRLYSRVPLPPTRKASAVTSKDDKHG